MPEGNKESTYQFRLTPEMKNRLKMIAKQLDTPLPDLLLTGAMMVFQKATNPAEYLRLKAEFIASNQPADPRGKTPIRKEQ